ncbi:hypothetical protein NVP1210O_51 [Vibrio phage 1.210.O._10N.222.52.C2]|nr:hypothetical protein NVP1210O_51 [Vibrio phage 1.210.O._10N.222.52.C2]
MGQGTESCGGYEIDYDEYEEGLGFGDWTQKNGLSINVSDMTLSHLKGARRIAERAGRAANFSCDAEKWEAWVDVFDDEIYRKSKAAVRKKAGSAPASPPRGKTASLRCACGKVYTPRVADLKRGWGKSCGKRCASIKREYGRSDAVCATTKISIKELLLKL